MPGGKETSVDSPRLSERTFYNIGALTEFFLQPSIQGLLIIGDVASKKQVHTGWEKDESHIWSCDCRLNLFIERD